MPAPIGTGAPALIVFSNNTVQSGANTRFLCPYRDDAAATVGRIEFVSPRAGVYQNLAVLHNTPQGAGPIVYTVEINQLPTALSVAMDASASLGTNDVASVAVSKGDLIGMTAFKALPLGDSPLDIYATFNFAGM